MTAELYKIFRNSLKNIHLYIGLVFGPIVLTLGITGAILAFEKEIDYKLNSSLWTVSPQETRVSLQSILESIQTKFHSQRFLRVEIQSNIVRPIVFSTSDDFQVFADPYSGAILGSRKYLNTFFGVNREIHRSLFLEGIGKQIVSVTSLVVIGLILSGLFLWWPRKKQSFRNKFSLKMPASWKGINFKVHSLLGFMASFYLFILAFTGVASGFNFAEKGIFGFSDSVLPAWKNHPFSRGTSTSRQTTLDEAFNTASKIIPNADWTDIILPQTHNSSFEINRAVTTLFSQQSENFIYIDKFDGAILRIDYAIDRPFSAELPIILTPLHEGTIWGLSTRVYAFLCSVALMFLVLGGIFL
ncbi:MAG: PepSY-associated TM helix domain-containing protein [Bdellovibrionota bacterium]